MSTKRKTGDSFQPVIDEIEQAIREPKGESRRFDSELALKIARNHGMNIREINVLFTQHVKKSIRDYIKERRMMRACDILVNSETDDWQASLDTAIDVSGYADQSAFGKAFRMQFGYTPKEVFNKGASFEHLIQPPFSMEDHYIAALEADGRIVGWPTGDEDSDRLLFGLPVNQAHSIRIAFELQSEYELDDCEADAIYRYSFQCWKEWIKENEHYSVDIKALVDALNELYQAKDIEDRPNVKIDQTAFDENYADSIPYMREMRGNYSEYAVLRSSFLKFSAEHRGAMVCRDLLLEHLDFIERFDFYDTGWLLYELDQEEPYSLFWELLAFAYVFMDLSESPCERFEDLCFYYDEFLQKKGVLTENGISHDFIWQDSFAEFGAEYIADCGYMEESWFRDLYRRFLQSCGVLPEDCSDLPADFPWQDYFEDFWHLYCGVLFTVRENKKTEEDSNEQG